MKTKKIIFSTLAVLLLLSSCATYRASTLFNPSPDLIELATKKEDISIVSKTFDQNDCKRFLDRDVLAEGYQPIQLYIQNDSDKNYVFSLNRISLSIARPEEVAEKVHTSTLGRAVGYGAGSLIFWPLAIPAIVDGFMSSNANAALDNDFFAKTARDQVIFSHSKFNAIIFVPIQEYQNSYTITLIDHDSKETKVFNVRSNE